MMYGYVDHGEEPKLMEIFLKKFTRSCLPHQSNKSFNFHITRPLIESYSIKPTIAYKVRKKNHSLKPLGELSTLNEVNPKALI